MKRTLAFVSGALALAAGLLPLGSAEAYQLLTPDRKWYQLPVMLEFNSNTPETSITDGDYGRAAIVDALFDANDGWNGAGRGQLLDARVLARNYNMGDGRPTIQFNDPRNYCTGACLAVTMTGYWHNRGGLEEIDDADIFFSDSTSFTSENEDTRASCGWQEFFIEGVLQHEIGHLLGLDHSNNNQATMFGSVAACDNSTDEIAADDQNGIQALY